MPLLAMLSWQNIICGRDKRSVDASLDNETISFCANIRKRVSLTD
jgi:hypothetical protein